MRNLWRRATCVLAIVLSLLPAVAPFAPARAQDGDDYVPGEVLVKLRYASQLPTIASRYRLDPTPIDRFGFRPIYRLRIKDGTAPPVKAAALAADPMGRVEFAEPNYEGQAPEGRQRLSWAKGGDAAVYKGQWARYTIRLPEAHAVTRGEGIRVAVLDTGVDAAHPALQGRLLRGYDFVDMDTNPAEVGSHALNPAYGHGTHVAGLVALAAPAAKIMPVRVLDPNGVGNAWVLAEALEYAADPDRNLLTDDGADVVNLSLGRRRPSELLSRVIKRVTCASESLPCRAAGGRGVVVVAAAGNSGSDIREYPAADGEDGLLAVGASTPTDALADFSTFGSWVGVAAPGEAVLSSVPGGGYGSWSGTSMAAPLVAGEAALVRAAFPGLGAEEVERRVRDTAAEIGGRVPLRIDAAAALGR